ncbi:MAG: polysaccharide ABC transporter ATP-binding protein [Ferruginibacter sp.]
MSNVVIKVENLSKQYRLGTVGTGSLAHDLNRVWQRLRGRDDPYLKIGEENDRTQKGNSEYVWALKDINFNVKKGEVLGIIGSNGAGKSTLLKILSRTTTPTTGSVKIKGRVASLLEVGTGFHPELSGRENIFLNGAILGMTKQEIKSKFDEIVDFSGVERYIDTPVKRYSSGMYVRLAFGVAAHLDPEILIVDEVLAVGDAEFQKKALGKMKDVSNKDGNTVLFVSHNLDAIEQLCKSSLLLSNGRIKEIGLTTDIIYNYLGKEIKHVSAENTSGIFNLKNNPNKTYSHTWGMQEVKLFVNEKMSNAPFTGCTFKIEVLVLEKKSKENLRIGLCIKNEENEVVLGINNLNYGQRFLSEPSTKKTIVICFEYFPIYGEGRYFVDLYLGNDMTDYETIKNAFFLDIRLTDVFLSGTPLNPNLNSIVVKDILFYEK